MPPTFPSYRISSILKNTHVPLGPRRAVSHSQNVFFIESFIGEMAHATAKEFARRCSTCWSRKATGASRCPGWVIFDRRADRTDARHRLLTGRQEQITREINKLQAIGQQILRKNSEPPPGLSLLRHANPFHVRRRHRRRADAREPMARHHPISCRRATPQPRPASVITTAAGRADSTGAAAAVPAPNFFTLALLSLRRAVCPIRSKKFS
jgi:hypothetical protein